PILWQSGTLISDTSCDIAVADDCGFTGITAMSVKKPTFRDASWAVERCFVHSRLSLAIMTAISANIQAHRHARSHSNLECHRPGRFARRGAIAAACLCRAPQAGGPKTRR